MVRNERLGLSPSAMDWVEDKHFWGAGLVNQAGWVAVMCANGDAALLGDRSKARGSGRYLVGAATRTLRLGQVDKARALSVSGHLSRSSGVASVEKQSM